MLLRHEREVILGVELALCVLIEREGGEKGIIISWGS